MVSFHLRDALFKRFKHIGCKKNSQFLDLLVFALFSTLVNQVLHLLHIQKGELDDFPSHFGAMCLCQVEIFLPGVGD